MSTINLPNDVTVTTFPLAPANFDPLSADQAALLRHGYPRRPDENPELLERWKRLLGRPLQPIEPSFRKVENIRHIPRLRAVDGGTETSTNWSGAVVFAPSGSTFDSVAGQWTVPNPNPAGDEITDYFSSSWVGIDGDGSPDVFQAGVDCEATITSGTTQRTIHPWWEWFPGSAVQITNFPVSAGDVLTCLLSVTLQYRRRILETGTTFAPETDGVWLMADYDRDGIPDLVFIRTSNTGTGTVEVHIAS
jgi:Peptidase A4 family